MSRREGQQGQGLVEFTLVLPVILLVLASVVELGLAFGNTHTLGYGSREGARVGSALATGLASGQVVDCTADPDPSGVDGAIISAVQRILKSPGSGLDVSKVQQIRIFKADSTGAELPNQANVWSYVGNQAGFTVDNGFAWDDFTLDFDRSGAAQWPACERDNSSSPPDSIGVTVTYRYDFITPLPSMLDAISGGNVSLTLSETTVMALNPTL